ncbi:MAG: transposase [Candidatus Aminicenantales bacterium]
MARQLRIEYPGAFYHVASRGNEKQRIFHEPEDNSRFLEFLSRAHDRFGVFIHAFCLMENHYHLFIETPEANLSRTLHFINTAYTVYLNKRRERIGHLFQGRFKAILVEADIYARELIRYIHLNPVRAGIVSRPEEYIWSSHREYMRLRKPSLWLDTSFTLKLFGDSGEKARCKYLEFISLAIDKQIKNPLKNEHGKHLLILGSDEFMLSVKKNFGLNHKQTPDRELPALRQIRHKPSLERISNEVKRTLRGNKRLDRNVAIYLAHKNADYKLVDIAKFYDLSVSITEYGYREVKATLLTDKNLLKSIEDIEKTLFP